MATAVALGDVYRDDIASEIEDVESELFRRDLRMFTGGAWSVLEPDVPLVWNWHLDALCEELTAISNNELKELLINVPPGTMKSLLVSVFWPAWEWTSKPRLKYLCASYVQDLAVRDTNKMRQLITSHWYQRRFPISLRSDQDAKTWFINTKGGWRIATSTDGKGTGEHPDRKIIDDPHSAKQARSPAERRAANDWLDQTMSTRGKSRGAATVIIMQRLHQEDMSGHVLSLGGWKHVCIPMRYEASQGQPPDTRAKPHPMDPRTKDGELMWPALFDEKLVQELERELRSYGTAGQLQQRPAPEGGGMFRRTWFPRVKGLPATDNLGKPIRWRWRRAWDVAATEGAGCYTSGVLIGDAGENVHPRFYISDVRRGQWGPKKVDDKIKGTAKEDGRLVSIREEQEPGASGKTVVTQRRLDLAGYDYAPVPPSGDKEVRAGPLAAQAEAGNVALVEGPWLEDFLQELEVFPNGAFLDQTDAAAHGFNDLMTGARPVKVMRAYWG